MRHLVQSWHIIALQGKLLSDDQTLSIAHKNSEQSNCQLFCKHANVITHPLTSTCFWCKISRLRQYRTATALKVIIAEMPVVRRVAKPFCSPLLERYWSEAEHLSNEL